MRSFFISTNRRIGQQEAAKLGKQTDIVVPLEEQVVLVQVRGIVASDGLGGWGFVVCCTVLVDQLFLN